MKYLKNSGTFQELSLEVPEKSVSFIPEKVGIPQLINISQGYELQQTPLHFLQAFSSTINGGLYTPLTLIKDKNNQQTRVFSSETSKKILHILKNSSENQSIEKTGHLIEEKPNNEEKKNKKRTNNKKNTQILAKDIEKRAQIDKKHPNIGKKSTLVPKTINDRRNKSKFMAYFAGVFPLSKPQYALLLILDEPDLSAYKNHDSQFMTNLGVDIINNIMPIMNINLQNQD